MTPYSIALANKMQSVRKGEIAAIPAGHVVALAVTNLFGPKGKKTPQGHPIHIDTGLFDNTVETALAAIMRVVNKREGIHSTADQWHLDMHEDVIQPHSHKQPVYFSKFYRFTYLPEQPLWKQRGLIDANGNSKVPVPFKSSWYLTKNHLTVPVPAAALATTLVPATK